MIKTSWSAQPIKKGWASHHVLSIQVTFKTQRTLEEHFYNTKSKISHPCVKEIHFEAFLP